MVVKSVEHSSATTLMMTVSNARVDQQSQLLTTIISALKVVLELDRRLTK